MEQSLDLSTFIESLAAGGPTPGGGSAAALAGALGASLAAMVGRLTIGRKRYADVEPQMQALVEQADRLRLRLTQLVSDDAAAFDQVQAAHRLPKDSALEVATRNQAIQEAFKAASRTPLDTVAACLDALRLAEQAVAAGNVNAATDGAVGALLAYAGLQGAVLNVRVNLTSIADAEFIATSQAAVAAALTEAEAIRQRVVRRVEDRLLPSG